MHSTSGEWKVLCLVASFPSLDSKKVMFALTSYAQLLTKIPPKCDIKGIINLDYGTVKVEQKNVVNIGMLVYLECFLYQHDLIIIYLGTLKKNLYRSALKCPLENKI